MTVEQARIEAANILKAGGKRLEIGDYVASDSCGRYAVHYFRQNGNPMKRVVVATVSVGADSRVTRVMKVTGRKHFFLPGYQPSRGIETIVECDAN
jgi:hypothetical protein